jgi:Zn ribbon nucleic-acid-binding protein
MRLSRDDLGMNDHRKCPRCKGYLLRVSGREADHRECLNCGFSDEQSPLTAIEARYEAEQNAAAEHAEAQSPAGD